MSAPRSQAPGVGIVGCGFTARQNHLPAATAAGARIVAVADTDPAAAAGLADPTGARAYPTTAALLADEAVEIVLVATPPGRHREVAVAALEAGRDVLVEKPLALSSDDCEAMIAARDRSGRLATVGFNLRHHPVAAAAREAIAAGEIGRPLLINHTWVGPSHLTDSGWAADPAAGGGLVFERGAHCIDLVRHLGGAGGAELEIAGAGGTGTGPLRIGLRAPGTEASVEMAVAPGHLNALRCAGEGGILDVDLYSFDGLERTGPGRMPGSLGGRLRAAARAPAKLPRGLRAARSGGVFTASYLNLWRDLLSAREDPAGAGPALAQLEDGLAVTRALNAAAAELGSAAGPPAAASAADA